MLLGVCSWEEPRSALDSGTVLPSTWSCYLQLPSQLAFLPGAWGSSLSLATSSLSSLCPSPPSASLGTSDCVVSGGFSRAVLRPTTHLTPLPTRMGLCQELDPVCRVLTPTPRGAETQKRLSDPSQDTQPLQDSICSDRLRLQSLHPRDVTTGAQYTHRPSWKAPLPTCILSLSVVADSL